jgi:hypothetical protein
MNKPQALFTAQGAQENHAGVHDSKASTANRVDPILSTATDTNSQLDRALALLRRGSQTTDSLRAHGIYQVSARIYGLRALGYSITTHLFNDFSTDGMYHQRMALYVLHESATDWRKDQSANGGE